LLFLVAGFCPHAADGGQRAKNVEPVLTPVLPAEPGWQIPLPFPPSAGAAMDERRAYLPLEGEHLVAIDRETGATVWTVDIESSWPPLVHDGVVYLAASDELHALDAETGNHRWRVPLERGAMAPMALTEAALIVLVEPDEVWALRPSDGHRLWLRPLGGRSGRVSMAVDATGISVALVDRLVRLRPDGSVRWEHMLPGQLTSTASARDRVLAGSTSNQLFAFHTDRGTLAWKYPVGGDVVGIAATGDLVFVVSLDNVVRALRRSSGNLSWKQELTIRPVVPPHLVNDDVVVVTGPESVAAFNAKTGAPLGTFDAPDLLQGRPLVDATPSPFAVSMLAVTRDGVAMGLRPVEMLFREQATQPLAALPGRPLQKEASPLP
jgi:outer membrane protein assembly factor BamB